jgi:hypothetical protein
LIILTNISKLSLSGKGLLTEPDEKRYYMTWSFLKHLLQGDINGSITAIFYLKSGRPLGFVIHGIPALLQYISAHIFNFELFESQNSFPVFFYNLLVFTLILYTFYKIVYLIFQDKTLALTGIFITGILVNNYVYLRHIYPYNESLLIFLFLTYRIINKYINRQKLNLRKTTVYGFLAFLALLIYPAYYLYFIAVFFQLIITQFFIVKEKKYAIKQCISFGIGSFIALMIIEVLSRSVNLSYIDHIIHLSGTVIQGSFSENFVFLFKYFKEVEQLNGLLLTAGMIIFFLWIILKKEKRHSSVIILFVSFLIPFLWHAGMGYFFHKYTFYGRIIHLFVPVIIIINLYVLNLINNKEARNSIILIIGLLMSIQFFFQLQSYRNIAYPRDVYWSYLKTYPRTKIVEISEYENSWSNLPQRLDSLYINPEIKDSISIVNGQYFYPVNDIKKYHKYTGKTGKLIFDKPHFINYKAYQYEGYGINERKLIDRMKLRIKVFKYQ